MELYIFCRLLRLLHLIFQLGLNKKGREKLAGTVSMITMILNITFALMVIFAERRNPAATWAWLMVIAVFPIGGFIIYLLLGQDSRKQRVFKQKAKEDENFLGQQVAPFEDIKTRNIGSIISLNAHSSDSGITHNNHVTLFHNGRTKYDALIDDITTATSFIFIQTYILREDEIGKHLVRQLTKRALDGVEVRLLIDGMGCIRTHMDLFRPLTDAGGKVGVFMPSPIRLNFRNHRKLAVIDGKAGYIGGLNIGKEYLGMTKRFGAWRDTHARFEGDAVHPLTLRFLMDWAFVKKIKPVSNSEYFPKHKTISQVRTQIVSSGPDTQYSGILYGFCKMITDAKKTLYIQTPYFVPDESLFGTLKVAALSGVDVRIMFPANPDHPFVYWAGLSYLGELLEAGVKAYEYTNGFMHTKAVMADGAICTIGSANVDVRSFKLNFETTAFIYDEGIALEMEAAFLRDMQDCRPITLEIYGSRGKIVKIKESVSRLFSPLL